MAAAEALLNRGWGQPTAYQEVGMTFDPPKFSTKEICRRVAFLFAQADKEAECQSKKTIEQPKIRSVG